MKRVPNLVVEFYISKEGLDGNGFHPLEDRHE